MTIRRTILFAAMAVGVLAGAGCGGIGNAQVRLRSAIDNQQSTLDGCYEQALVRDKSLTGNMTLWLHVTEKGGTVTEVEVENSTVNDPELTQCVQNSLVGVSIDPKPKANLKVEYQLEFTPKA